jgi:hypothetical protein
MLRLLIFSLLFSLSCFSIETAPLFVSLGSDCNAAHTLKACKLRNASYPFDWITSHDGEGLIKVFEEDFSWYLEAKYLSHYLRPPSLDEWILINTRYNFEFIHDGNPHESLEVEEKIKEKCFRRLNRFKELGQFDGRVYFLREARVFHLDDRLNFTRYHNYEMSEEYSIRLYNTLKDFFPKLDIHLVIVNHYAGTGMDVEKTISDRIYMVRTNLKETSLDLISEYQVFFNRLIHRFKVHD